MTASRSPLVRFMAGVLGGGLVAVVILVVVKASGDSAPRRRPSQLMCYKRHVRTRKGNTVGGGAIAGKTAAHEGAVVLATGWFSLIYPWRVSDRAVAAS
jgi:hypothetical protein